MKPLSALPDAGSIGAGVVTVRELADLSVAYVAVAPLAFSAANAQINQAFGVPLPEAGRRRSARSIAFLRLGADQWLATSAVWPANELVRQLKTSLGSLASVADASDGRVVVEIVGPRARAVLSRGIPLDLCETSFEIDDVASTHAAHIPVAIWRIDDAPTFHVAVSRSYAHSFASWLSQAARSDAAAPL